MLLWTLLLPADLQYPSRHHLAATWLFYANWFTSPLSAPIKHIYQLNSTYSLSSGLMFSTKIAWVTSQSDLEQSQLIKKLLCRTSRIKLMPFIVMKKRLTCICFGCSLSVCPPAATNAVTLFFLNLLKFTCTEMKNHSVIRLFTCYCCLLTRRKDGFIFWCSTTYFACLYECILMSECVLEHESRAALRAPWSVAIVTYLSDIPGLILNVHAHP